MISVQFPHLPQVVQNLQSSKAVVGTTQRLGRVYEELPLNTIGFKEKPLLI
jgi:hypothetical protein